MILLLGVLLAASSMLFLPKAMLRLRQTNHAKGLILGMNKTLETGSDSKKDSSPSHVVMEFYAEGEPFRISMNNGPLSNKTDLSKGVTVQFDPTNPRNAAVVESSLKTGLGVWTPAVILPAIGLALLLWCLVEWVWN